MGDSKKRRKSGDGADHRIKKKSKKRENKDKRHKPKDKTYKSREQVNQEPPTDDESGSDAEIDVVGLDDDAHKMGGVQTGVCGASNIRDDDDNSASDDQSDVDDHSDAQSDSSEASEMKDCGERSPSSPASPASQSTASTPGDLSRPPTPGGDSSAVVEFVASDGEIQLRQNSHADNTDASGLPNAVAFLPPAPHPIPGLEHGQNLHAGDINNNIDAPGLPDGAALFPPAPHPIPGLEHDQNPHAGDMDGVVAPDLPNGADFLSSAPPPIPGLEHRQADIAARREEHRREGTNGPNFIHTIIFNR